MGMLQDATYSLQGCSAPIFLENLLADALPASTLLSFTHYPAPGERGKRATDLTIAPLRLKRKELLGPLGQAGQEQKCTSRTLHMRAPGNHLGATFYIAASQIHVSK